MCIVYQSTKDVVLLVLVAKPFNIGLLVRRFFFYILPATMWAVGPVNYATRKYWHTRVAATNSMLTVIPLFLCRRHRDICIGNQSTTAVALLELTVMPFHPVRLARLILFDNMHPTSWVVGPVNYVMRNNWLRSVSVITRLFVFPLVASHMYR